MGRVWKLTCYDDAGHYEPAEVVVTHYLGRHESLVQPRVETDHPPPNSGGNRQGHTRARDLLPLNEGRPVHEVPQLRRDVDLSGQHIPLPAEHDVCAEAEVLVLAAEM